MSHGKPGQPSAYQPALPPILPADPAAIAEVASLRHAEMAVLRDRLARLESAPRGAWFSPAGLLLLGASVGGALAGIPVFGSDAEYEAWVKPVYWILTCACGLVAVLCLVAHQTIGRQREDSISAIREDFDQLLQRYPGAQTDTNEV